MKENNEADKEGASTGVGLERIVMCDFLQELELVDEDDNNRLPDDTPCHCENYDDCDWEGIISDCETAMDSEGWEYPEYEVLVCPKCGEYSIEF